MSLIIGPAKQYPSILMSAPTANITNNAFAMAFFTCSSFFAPKCLDMTTPIPDAIPLHKEKNRKLIIPTDPTPPSAFAPR